MFIVFSHPCSLLLYIVKYSRDVFKKPESCPKMLQLTPTHVHEPTPICTDIQGKPKRKKEMGETRGVLQYYPSRDVGSGREHCTHIKRCLPFRPLVALKFGPQQPSHLRTSFSFSLSEGLDDAYSLLSMLPRVDLRSPLGFGLGSRRPGEFRCTASAS